MAKKPKAKAGSGTLVDVAEALGALLGNAERQWRAWQAPRDAVVRAVTDVRDRAAALLSEIGTETDAAADTGSKKGPKKKDKKDKKDKKAKRGKKAKKAKKDKKAEAEKAATKNADKTAKKKAKGDEKAERKTGQKRRTSARPRTAATAAAEPLAEAPAADRTVPDAGDTTEP